MSIEYYVEGKITTQTEGNQRNFSKGNIEHNSLKNVNQQGTDMGVSLNSPDEIHDNDTPVNIVEVSLNLFFDGTQNNKSNTNKGKHYEKSNHIDDSYTNDLSNVARGFDAIDPSEVNQVAEYIEGIATLDGESETNWLGLPNNLGSPFGMGDWGIQAKVMKGCQKGAKALNKFKGKKGINLKVNVFGFSRGAAAARHFLHIATTKAKMSYSNGKEIIKIKPPYDSSDPNDTYKITDKDGTKNSFMTQYGYFGACLILNNVIPEKIFFNFVGLYDTVASYGPNHRGNFAINGDTEELKLNAISKAYFVLQIASDDEYRDNFDLTNIDSLGVRGLQFTLPGVHSDIGGCYVNGDEENVDLYLDNGNIPGSGAKFRQTLIDEGWYHSEQIVLDKLTPDMPGIVPVYMLRGKRKLFSIYDKIPLNTMFHYSELENFGVKYDVEAKKDHVITDSFLIGVESQLISYMNTCNTLRTSYVAEYNKSNKSGNYLQKLKATSYLDYITLEDLEILRNRYLHWSSSVIKTGFGPKVGEVTNGKNRKRFIQNG